jgi:hypothetical protein
MLLAMSVVALAITMNGKPVSPPPKAISVNGTTFLSLRDLARVFGGSVDYIAAKHLVIIKGNGQAARVMLQPRPGFLLHGHSYLPLRVIASAFHINATYDGPAKTIALTSRIAALPSYTHSASAAPVQHPAALVTPRFPQSGAQIPDSFPAISALIAPQGGADINPSAIQMRIDGNDVTASATVIGNQIVYTPRMPLSNGVHSVQIDGTDRDGLPFTGAWSFTSNFTPPSTVAPSPGLPVGLQTVYIDRALGAGDRYFDVIAYGQQGGLGTVTIDGVPGIYSLIPQGANRYVAHVTLPLGIDQPYARVNVHYAAAGGQMTDYALPATFQVYTIFPARVFAPQAAPAPAVAPTLDPGMPRRGVIRATPAPVASRVPLSAATATPPPHPVATPTAHATPVPVITPIPAVTPPSHKRRILSTPRPVPTPTPTPKPS